MTVLQELLFPNLETCSDLAMYFRTEDEGKRAYVVPEAGEIRVPRWCSLDMDTYFNGFSVGKWRRYTRLDNLSLRLELKGEFRVQLIHWQRLKDECTRSVVFERICKAEERTAFVLEYPGELPPRGMCACALLAVGEDCAFYGGQYETDVDESLLNPVDIAIDICTYRREKYVEANLDKLHRDILDATNCELGRHLEVFVSDNGGTLDAGRLSDGRVHVFPNRNAGGAGGFARGMLEIQSCGRAFSHILLMDDDVLINSDALVRTYRLLRMLKPECVGKTIGGALMRLDLRHVQYECGAVWNGVRPRPRKHNRDMRKLKNVLKNEQEETIDYNGWWYCCMPMAQIAGDNLPLPVFVHRDDVEYGIRIGSDILTLNGICLWHESFDNRYSSTLEYYEVRNDLILNALRGQGFSGVRAAYSLLYRTVGNVVRYRYENCDLMFMGVDDFLKGPDYLKQADPEALNREIMARGQKMLPIEQLDIPFREKDHVRGLPRKKSWRTTLRVYLLNGHFLPAKGVGISNVAAVWPRNFYRKKAVLSYDELTQKGFVSRRSLKKALSAMFRAAGKGFQLIRRFGPVGSQYRLAEAELTSRAFWKAYLGLGAGEERE